MNETVEKDKLPSKEKEVWESVKNYTKLIVENDYEGFLEYFHDDYSGWNYKTFLPVKKSDIKNELLYLPKRKVIWYELIPLTIKAFNDLGIVHYIYSVKYQDTNGKEREKNGMNADILLKQNNRWMIIADNLEFFDTKSYKKLRE